MGVDGLHKFINKNCPDAVKNVNISELRGKSCVIDGMQHGYSQLIYMRIRNKEVITKDDKNISHIHGLINSLKYYLKYEIIPIFVFDGKSPEIKKKKIEERKKILRENLDKMDELKKIKESIKRLIDNNDIDNITNNSVDRFNKSTDFMNTLIYGTPPTESYLNKYSKNTDGDYIINEINDKNNANKLIEIEDEYRKIYKKSILFKDYFIIDWIEILKYLGLPVIKAEGEADPLCSYILKYNPNVYGIISDDSDMLVFGSPLLMRKAKNQNFSVIQLDILIESINKLLNNILNKDVQFTFDDFVNFSILLGTDYGTMNLLENINEPIDILIYYINNDKNYKKIIKEEQYDEFETIKKYYTDNDKLFERKYDNLLMKPVWDKPKLMELKKRLLELDVDEEYIDEMNELFDNLYGEIKNSKKKKKINYENSIKIYSKTNKYENNFSDIFTDNNYNKKNKINYNTNNNGSDEDINSHETSLDGDEHRNSEDIFNMEQT
jgi:5'-3' exonuclease